MSRKERGKGWGLIRACETCGWPANDCRCSRPRKPEHTGPPLFRLRVEKRRGKLTTVADAEGLPAEEGRPLLKELKSCLATGGTLKGAALELQGDHRERLRELLGGRGYRVKG